ncbi:MAG TPA: TIR domain-containing protein [Bacteroidota bacterium]|nr:TIR domain-containing protein [Bacteroidota bacterium]
MSEEIVKRFEELIEAGEQLLPQGGFDFSGYNARLQNQYLDWRRACLEILELSGPIGFSYKNKITRDMQGGFFYQTSANLILGQMKELYEKLKASPELTLDTTATKELSAASTSSLGELSGTRTLRPPVKSATPSLSAPASSASNNKVYVIGESNDPLRIQLEQFLKEISIEEVVLERQHGQMLNLDAIADQANVKYAFFVLTMDDLGYAMFELGHFVGKLGKGNVCVLHMTDVPFPPNVPGVSDKPIVVKLEEASLGVMKELKALGYKIHL